MKNTFHLSVLCVIVSMLAFAAQPQVCDQKICEQRKLKSYLVRTNPAELYKNIDPEVTKFLIKLWHQEGKPIYELSPHDARKVLDDVQAASVGTVPADVVDMLIPQRSKEKVAIRIIRPQGNNELLPAVVYFHGGGWILGNLDTHDRLARELAVGANAAVVLVNYWPSPEAQYPVPVEQAYMATNYVVSHAQHLNIDPTRIAVAGDSVGGNMATVVAMLAKERKEPNIIFQLLFYPVTDASFDTPSYHEFAQDFWLTKKAMQWFWNAYAPSEKVRTLPTVSPLRATFAQLRGLPSTLLITDANDVLRDEGEAYASKLMQAGVHVVAVRYFGMIHDFVMLDPLRNTAATRSALLLATQTLKKVFAQ